MGLSSGLCDSPTIYLRQDKRHFFFVEREIKDILVSKISGEELCVTTLSINKWAMLYI